MLFSKFAGLRAGIVTILAVVLLINVAIFSRSEPDYYTNASDGGLEKSLDALTSTEYTELLRKGLLEANKEMVLDLIKQDLYRAHREQFIADLRKEVKGQYEENFIEELQRKLNDQFTNSFYTLKEKDYGLLQGMEREFYEENKENLKTSRSSRLLTRYLPLMLLLLSKRRSVSSWTRPCLEKTTFGLFWRT